MPAYGQAPNAVPTDSAAAMIRTLWHEDTRSQDNGIGRSARALRLLTLNGRGPLWPRPCRTIEQTITQLCSGSQGKRPQVGPLGSSPAPSSSSWRPSTSRLCTGQCSTAASSASQLQRPAATVPGEMLPSWARLPWRWTHKSKNKTAHRRRAQRRRVLRHQLNDG
jgi:hypothetical protein